MVGVKLPPAGAGVLIGLIQKRESGFAVTSYLGIETSISIGRIKTGLTISASARCRYRTLVKWIVKVPEVYAYRGIC